MRKRSSKNHAEKQERQEESLANPDLLSSEASGKNPAAVALGRLGGAKGGKARAAALTPEQRSEIAKKAAAARWAKKR
jgi:hypothetical protein